MRDALTTTTPDGRTVGFADFGTDGGLPVLDCHGGPGNRLAASRWPQLGSDPSLRFVGIDRPGYGLSTPQPGRTIADWVPDALAVADALGLDRFVVLGCSTGASYALATAALAPDRVQGVLVACGMTDMRWAAGRDLLAGPDAVMGDAFRSIWDAPDRAAALAIAVEQWGEDGSKAGTPSGGADPADIFCQADVELFFDPAFLTSAVEERPHSFTFGVQGYVDDRIADGRGWDSFDVDAIRCPVVVLNGLADKITPVALAGHTASLVPGARLELVPDLGHLSIVRAVPDALDRLVASLPA